jgi:iron complex outermembrane receptor protein
MIFFVELMSNRSSSSAGVPAWSVLTLLALPAAVHAQVTSSPTLPSVFVTATRYEQESISTPAYLTVITRDQIEKASVSTVNEAVSRLGGLATRTSLNGGNELTIDPMGFGDTAGSNLRVLIDGMPIRDGDATEIRLSGIPIESVDRIEIQRSSGGVLYGGGSTGGVLNIITRTSSVKRHEGSSASLYAGRGSFSTDEYRFSGQYVKDGLELSIAASDRQSSGFRAHSANSDRGIFFNAKFNGDVFRAGMSLSNEDSYAQSPGPLSEIQYRTDRRMAQPDSVANKTRGIIETTRLAVFLERELANVVWRLDSSLRWRDLDSVAVKGGFPSSFNFNGNDNFLSLTGQRSFDLMFGQNQVLFGVERGDWSQFRRYPPSLGFGNFQLDFNSISYFIRDDIDIPSLGMRLTAGYRSERNERSQLSLLSATRLDNNYDRSAWELGLSKRIDDDNSVYARIATSFRFANIDEFGSSYNLDQTTRILLPQTSRDQEIGWKRNLGSRGRFDIRAYRSDLMNELAFRNELGLVTGPGYSYILESNVNLQPTRRQGLDFDLSYQWSPAILVGSSLSIRDAKFREGEFSGKRIPMSASEIVSLRGEYAIDDRQRVGVMSRWTSSQYVALDFDNNYPMPSYTVSDLYYQHKTSQFDFAVKVLNIFDQNYYSYATRVTASGATPAYTAVYPDFGRSFWVSARWRF